MICQDHKPNLHLKFDKGIEVKAKPAYPNEDIPTFNHLEIFQNGKLLFKDTTHTEYTVEDTLYPKLYDFKNHLELLIEIDNRPGRNLIYKFFLENQKLVRLDTMPTFLTSQKNLDCDDKKEVAGFWNYFQVGKDSIEYTWYTPIVFYEICEKGIQLDSLTTIRVNEEIYGKFYGFKTKLNIRVPYKEDGKFSKELERILNE